MEQPAGDANNHRGFTQAYAAYTGREIDKATSASLSSIQRARIVRGKQMTFYILPPLQH